FHSSLFAGTIAVFVLTRGFSSDLPVLYAGQIVPEAKVSLAISAKPVPISDPAPYIEPPIFGAAALFEGIQFGRANCFRALSHLRPGGDDVAAAQIVSYGKIVEIAVRREFAVNEPAYPGGRKVPPIMKSDIARQHSIFRDERRDALWQNAHVSSMQYSPFTGSFVCPKNTGDHQAVNEIGNRKLADFALAEKLRPPSAFNRLI